MKALVLVWLALVCALPAPAADSAPLDAPLRPELVPRPADKRPAAAASTILAVARAGKRIVAVGERGTVLLSDDGGTSFRQAEAVPISATLTGVSFVDALRGWAVGHWGAILRTDDGGATWKLQHSDLSHDQPLLAVHFLDAERGVAVGLWSLVMVTRDGGRSWQRVSLPAPAGARKADLNLQALFPGRAGEVFACAEQGRLLRSADGGQHWQYLDTGYKGSLWAGVALADGTLLVGGLRGKLLASGDGGQSWNTVASDTHSSITGLAQLRDGRVIASALDGVVLVGETGLRFGAKQSLDRMAFTAVIENAAGKPVLMTRAGPRVQLP